MTYAIQNYKINKCYSPEKAPATSKLAALLTLNNQPTQRSFFGCPCPSEWNNVSEYALGIFFGKPLTEEKHWDQFLIRYNKPALKETIQKLCEEAIAKYPDLKGRTTLEVFFNSFETAVKKGDYIFSKKLLQAHPEIDPFHFEDFTFVVNGGLHPAFKQIPEFFDLLLKNRGGFLREDLNSSSLFVAISEKPSAVKRLLESSVIPSSAHLDEAISLNRDEIIDLLLLHGARFTPLSALKAVELENLKLINKICRNNYDLWPYMYTQAKRMDRQPVIAHLLGMPLTPNCHLFLMRQCPRDLPDPVNLNLALLEIEEDQLVLKIIKERGLRPDAVSLGLALERGCPELIAHIYDQGVEESTPLSLTDRFHISKSADCLIDEFPEFLKIIKEKDPFIKRNIEYYCVLAHRKFPELKVTSIDQFLSGSFEAAVAKEDFRFAKKLLESGAKFVINISFVTNGDLNPVFEKIPQIFEYRGLLQSDLNQTALLVALRKMPQIAPSIWHRIDPTPLHMNEALCQENDQAIAYFRKKKISPTADPVEVALQRNDVRGMKRLLDLGAPIPSIGYDIYCNPLYRDMVVLLKRKGIRFTSDYFRYVVDNKNYSLIQHTPPSHYPQMLIYAYNTDNDSMISFLMPLIFQSKEIKIKKVESCCLSALVRYPLLPIEGKSLYQYFADAFVHAVEKEDYSLAIQLLKADAEYNITSKAHFSIVVHGEVNPVFKALLPKLGQVALKPVTKRPKAKRQYVIADIEDLSENTYRGLLQRLDDFPQASPRLGCYTLLYQRKTSTKEIYLQAEKLGMNSVCRYLEEISPSKRIVELHPNPRDEYIYLNRYGLEYLDQIFEQWNCKINWEDVLSQFCDSNEIQRLCEEEMVRNNTFDRYQSKLEDNHDLAAEIVSQINNSKRKKGALESDIEKGSPYLEQLESEKERLKKNEESYQSNRSSYESRMKEASSRFLSKDQRKELIAKGGELEAELFHKRKSEFEIQKELQKVTQNLQDDNALQYEVEALESKKKKYQRLERLNQREIEEVTDKIKDLNEERERVQLLNFEEIQNESNNIAQLEMQYEECQSNFSNLHRYPVDFLHVFCLSLQVKKAVQLLNFLGGRNQSALKEWKKRVEKGDFESQSPGGISLKEIIHLAFSIHKLSCFHDFDEENMINFPAKPYGKASFLDYLLFYWQSDHLGSKLNLEEFCEQIIGILNQKGVCRVDGVVEAFRRAFEEIRGCYHHASN